MDTGKFNAGGNPEMDWHPIQGGVGILLVASCYRNQDKLQPDGPLGLYADLTNCTSQQWLSLGNSRKYRPIRPWKFQGI